MRHLHCCEFAARCSGSAWGAADGGSGGEWAAAGVALIPETAAVVQGSAAAEAFPSQLSCSQELRVMGPVLVGKLSAAGASASAASGMCTRWSWRRCNACWNIHRAGWRARYVAGSPQRRADIGVAPSNAGRAEAGSYIDRVLSHRQATIRFQGLGFRV